MAMGSEKGGGATLQHEIVCLDELVPVDDVREQAEPYYAEALGRPSVDPIVLVKLMLAAAIEGIGSVRELLRVAPLRLDLRRFLGYGLGERLPVHQTVSDAQARRFLDGRLFEQLFLRSVALCSEHNLFEGTHLSVDGFHAEANAALQSLRASLEPLPEPEGPAPAPAAEPSPPSAPQLSLAEPRSGPTPKRRSSNASSRSLSDPDARLRGKPGQRPHLVHLGQVAVDPKARCVAACLGERADGFEGDGLEPLLERARFALPPPPAGSRRGRGRRGSAGKGRSGAESGPGRLPRPGCPLTYGGCVQPSPSGRTPFASTDSCESHRTLFRTGP
jgi:transposase